MKNYYIDENNIIVTNLKEFNIIHILECGQVFRYKKDQDGYVVYSKDKMAKITSYRDKIIIETDDVDYFINYFDLDTSYADIKNQLSKFEVLVPMLSDAYGIRILNQDPFEMIICFIISANNNIKRIQMIIENICAKFGNYNEKNEFFEFPSREQLMNASVQDFVDIGAGYRANYLYKVVRELENFDYDYVKSNSSEKSLPYLLSLSGVGPKVADCILLFGFHKGDVFPVDTWIVKVYNSYFSNELVFDTKKIRRELTNIFGNLSGYAQQYLFYYKRILEKVNSNWLFFIAVN